MPRLKKIAVLTSGGDAPGMNAAVRAVTRGGLARGWEVFAVRNGYAGLLANTLEPLAARDVGGIIQSGGTVLGSARCPEFAEPAGRAEALATLAKHGIDALVVIGGGAEVIALPESELKPAELAARLRAAYQRGKTHALAVIAEGAKCGVKELMDYYGHHRHDIGFDLRVTRLGHVVRGGIPSAADRVLATRLGAAAIDTLARGKHGVLVGIIKAEVVTTPLAEIAGKMR